MAMIILSCVCLALFAGANGDSAWTYYDGPSADLVPADWGQDNAGCNGTSNSPIDLTGATTDSSLSDLTFTGYDSATSGSVSMFNSGHSLEFEAPGALTMSGGPLSATYNLAQFHMHWGSVAGQGSEHKVDGTAYEAEIHFVHYNSGYDNLTEAVSESDGLAVLGVFVSVADDDNPAFALFVDHLDEVAYSYNGTYALNAFTVGDFFPNITETYYTYSGGLTTPGCNEVVTWIHFSEPITASVAQLNKLRTMLYLDSENIVMADNYRPVQALNSRTISYRAAASFAPRLHSSMAITSLFTLLGSLYFL